MRYLKDDNVFYQNNPAAFVTYLTETTAVINVSLSPNFDTNVSGHCQGCNIGDSDNKIQCTCEETEHVLELLEQNTDDTIIPIIVNVNMIYDEPIVIIEHKKEVDILRNKRKEIAENINILTNNKCQLSKEVNDLTSETENLRRIKENYGQLKEIDLSEFCERLGVSMSQIMYAENDSRSIMGGVETREFKFNGKTYEIKVSAFWEKSTYFNYELKCIDLSFIHTEPFIEF